MEHLWRQSYRVGLLIGSKTAGMRQFWSGGLGVVPPGVSCAPWFCGFLAPADLQHGQQDHSWFCTSCRPCLTSICTAGYLAGTEPPGQSYLRWGWSHEGCSGLTVIAPFPMLTSDVADRVPTPQMFTLALDAKGLCSNVSGQQLGIPSGSCVRRGSFCWLLLQLIGGVSSSGGFLSTLLQGTSQLSWVWLWRMYLVGILFHFFVRVSWWHFSTLKDISHLPSQDTSVLRSSCSWVESVGVLMTE